MIQQKNIKKIQNNIIFISIPLICFLNNRITDNTSYNAFVSLPFFKNFQYKIITMPELYIAMFVLITYIIFLDIYSYISRKKVEKEPENNDGTKNKLIFILNIIVICLAVFCVILSSVTLITKKSIDIPEVSDGLYLDVHDFGIADKITDKNFNHNNKHILNKMSHIKTLSAQMWITREYYDINDKRVSIYQDIIEYKSQKTALYAAELLASEKNADYKETAAEGFEKVYLSSEDIVAVIGNTTYRLTYITTEESLVPTSEQLLKALLEKHNDTMNLSE